MLELTIRLVVSLAFVVGLLLLIAKISARRFRGNSGALVQVVQRQALSRSSSIAVVTVGDRVLVVGATESHVSLLTELDPDELEIADVIQVAPTETLRMAAPDETVPAIAATHETTAVRRTAGAHRAAHRAAPRTSPRTPTADATPLGGSVLSVQTWKQALAAASGRTREVS